MDKITFKTSLRTLGETGDKTTYLEVDTFLNGNQICKGTPIDIFKLDDLTKENSEVYLFSCDCGVPECAGIRKPVKVVVSENYMVLGVFQPELLNIKVDIKEFKETIEKLKSDLIDKMHINKWRNIHYFPYTKVSDFITG